MTHLGKVRPRNESEGGTGTSRNYDTKSNQG